MIIYNKNGIVFLDTVVDDSSFLYNEICGSEYVRLDFSLTEYAEIPLGAYIIYRDVQYTLHEAPTIEMVSQEEYKITATFEAPAKQLELYSLRNHVDKRVDFMLTAKPAEHVGMVLEALRVRDKAWALGNCIDAAEKTITYSYVSCMEALQMIADAFDTEWEIVDHTINLGKVEHLNDAPLRLSYGKDFGLNPGVGRANLGEARISAVYPQGTDRNINASTYGNPTLLLPKDQLIAYDGYRFDDELGYDKSNAVLYSTDIWGTCVYSASSSGVEAEGVLDCTEIYPQREGTVTNVVVRNADSNLYDIQDNTIPDSLDYQAAIIPGNELSIVFQSGMLAGKEFGASYIHNGATDSTKRLFQIRAQEYDGVMMPGDNYIPQIGDKYAVFGVALPESYLADNDTKTGASWDMLRKCVKHLYEAEKPQYSFTGELSSKWLRQEISRVAPYLRIGAVISFGRVAFQPEAVLVRVESIKQYINTPYSVELTLGDRVIPAPYKITSKAVESRRAVEVRRIASQTAMQLNAVKQNAVAPPPVNDTVPFANDLTGVIEATAEEFTYRPSAGNRSIRDASAVIRRIKGNTVVWHQHAPELSVNNYTIRGDVVTQSDNSLHITSLNPDNKIFIQDLKSIPFRGHKWLSIADVKSDEELTIKGMSSVGWTPNERCLVSSFYTSTNNNEWYWGVSYKTNVPSYVDIYSFNVFDLTQMFDAGNEPSTIEEFYARIPEGVDINAYNEGEVIPMNAIGIETIGFNQWDEQWVNGYIDVNKGHLSAHNERIASANFCSCLPNTEYYFKLPTKINILFYDEFRNYISYFTVVNSGTRITPKNAHFFKINTYVDSSYGSTYNNDICINLSHSGVRNGEYEPYETFTRDISWVKKYFPEGMRSAGSVYDEITSEKAIQRVEVVDLGSLEWRSLSTATADVYRFYSTQLQTVIKRTSNTREIANLLCVMYATTSADNTFAANKGISLNQSGTVIIFDPKITGKGDAASFKSAMQGVLLYYELADPKVTPITEPIQLDYEVDDFGTEKAVAFGKSAPFRADIVYQFNAEGRIRDNSRNIERIENTITNRLIPSQTAMLGLPNKVMTWNGSAAMMSLPIAESIADWELVESRLGVLPTGKQVMDYINIIKGSLAIGLIPKETLTIGASGSPRIYPNKAYEITTASNTNYNVVLKIDTIEGVDAAADNEWRIRVDTRNGFSGSIVFNPLDGYLMRWAYSDVSGPLTAPNIEAGHIWDIQFRMVGKTLLGSYKKY